jgi:GNAT superfamily N-acetyltransferase
MSVIRVATTGDAAGIARVQVTTWRAAYAGLVPDPVLDALSVPASASRWEGHVAEPAARVWVAERDGEVAGFLSGGPARDDDLGGGTGEVYAVYVRPGCQGAGLGRGLLETAAEWFRGSGWARSALWVLTGNEAARAFYARCGYSWDGSERGIDVGGAVVPEVRYLRDL